MARPIVRLDEELPRTLAVGGGSYLRVSGSCEVPGHRLLGLRVLIDGEPHLPISIGAPTEAGDRAIGFVSFLPLPPIEGPRSVRLELETVLVDGVCLRHPLGQLDLRPGLAGAAPSPAGADRNAPVVAICMATFDPEPSLLERQLESIRAQTHDAWRCVISDGGSSEARFERLRSLTTGDPRFALSRSEERLGAYRNFERALSMTPPNAAFVALADQDDRWYPDKLAELLAQCSDARLAYSDMRVVDESGRLVSKTFWSGRRNNYENLASLLLANTVTGAASLFSADVLDLALPFPPPVGDAAHDHWIAAVALATGRIAYVDRPLYDYVQHRGASRGHAAALRPYRPRRRVRWRDPGATAREFAAYGRQSYLGSVCRIALTARTLEIRAAAEISGRKRRTVGRVARLGSSREPWMWLALRSLRRLWGRNETMGVEPALLTAIIWRKLAAARARRRAARAPSRAANGAG